MGGGEDVMAGAIDVLCLADGETAPKHEYDACTLLRQSLYGGIGEEFPSSMLVRACLVGADGEGGVEKKHPLVGPVGEIARGERDVGAEVAVDFLNDIDEGGRHWDPCGDGEAETVCLAGFVVGVLSEDDHFHLVEGGMVECGKDVAPLGVAYILLPFGNEECLELFEIGSLKLRLEYGKPGRVDFR